MSEEKNDGGQVYPRIIKETPDQASRLGRNPQEFSYPGITRRDWLAGLAMQAFISSPTNLQTSINTAKKFNTEPHLITAEMAYIVADAMIAESNK